MATTSVYTAVDVVEHLLDVMGCTGSTDAITIRKCKRALEAAYRDVPNIRGWSYYNKLGSLILNGYYNTGTIEYDHTGGASERMVTLTTGTWPTWAKYGFIRIAQVDYEIASRESNSVITLSVNSNPGADISSGTSYEIMRDTYPLPVDLQAMGLIRDPVNSWYPQYLSPSDYMACRNTSESANNPRNYTLIADQNYVGTIAIRFQPAPDDDYSYEFLYRRTPRQLGTYQYNTGTVTTSGTTLTGVGTTFTADMIGTVFRPGTSSLAPTSYIGSNPYVAQRIVTSYTSSTVLGLDQALDNEVTAVKYELSDPIDIEAGAMYTAFLRRAEWELAIMMKRDDIPRWDAARQQAEIYAAEADSRSFDVQGTAYTRRVPLRFTVTEG